MSSICTRQFTIPENSDCTVFDDIVWLGETVSGSASGIFIGTAFSVQATKAGNGFFASQIDNTGQVTYTGPEITCNLHVVVTQLSGTLGTGGRLNVRIESDIDGLILNPGVSSDSDSPGTYDFPFVVPSSVGAILSVTPSARAGDADTFNSHGNVVASLVIGLAP